MFSCSTFQEILASYGRLQLNLTRGSSESSSLVEQLLDVVTRELDLGSSSSSASRYIFYMSSLQRDDFFNFYTSREVMNFLIKKIFRGDSTKDDKFGTLSSYQNSLVELAAHVLYRVYVYIHFILYTRSTNHLFDFSSVWILLHLPSGFFFKIDLHYDFLKYFCSALNFDFVYFENRFILFQVQPVESHHINACLVTPLCILEYYVRVCLEGMWERKSANILNFGRRLSILLDHHCQRNELEGNILHCVL